MASSEISVPKTMKFSFSIANEIPIHPDPVPRSQRIEPSAKFKLFRISIRTSVSGLGIRTL